MPPDPTPSPSPRPDPDDAARLWDMLSAAREVELFARGRTYADFLSDLMLRRSIERSTEIIGEAARNVSPSFQAAHPEIPWNPIIVQRHRLAHEYAAIREELIWKVATVHVPALIALVEPLLPPPPRVQQEEP